MTDINLYTGYDGDYDDYQAEEHRDRKAAEGMYECDRCGDFFHADDGDCNCGEETEDET